MACAGAVACAAAGVLLLWPRIAGWEPAQHSRQQVEARYSDYWGRVTAKLVRPADIGVDVETLLPRGLLPDGPVWVVVTKEVPTQPPGGWAFLGIAADRNALRGLSLSPELDEYRPSYPFDGLRDRAFPAWWPVFLFGKWRVPVGIVATLLAVALAIVGVGRPRYVRVRRVTQP